MSTNKNVDFQFLKSTFEVKTQLYPPENVFVLKHHLRRTHFIDKIFIFINFQNKLLDKNVPYLFSALTQAVLQDIKNF